MGEDGKEQYRESWTGAETGRFVEHRLKERKKEYRRAGQEQRLEDILEEDYGKEQRLEDL